MSELALGPIRAGTRFHKIFAQGAFGFVVAVLGAGGELVAVQAIHDLAAFGGGFGEVVEVFGGAFLGWSYHLHHEILYNYLAISPLT